MPRKWLVFSAEGGFARRFVFGEQNEGGAAAWFNVPQRKVRDVLILSGLPSLEACVSRETCAFGVYICDVFDIVSRETHEGAEAYRF